MRVIPPHTKQGSTFGSGLRQACSNQLRSVLSTVSNDYLLPTVYRIKNCFCTEPKIFRRGFHEVYTMKYTLTDVKAIDVGIGGFQTFPQVKGFGRVEEQYR